MVRNFKGVVKVADVQAEFDNLLNAINNKIDTYNSSLNIEDVDYNNGGSDLAAYGYTLSVGGLKAVLDAYDGAILGANVLRISNNQYIVSEGLYIKNRIVTKLPSKVLSGSGKNVYFSPSNNNYSFVEGGDATVDVPYTLPTISGSDYSAIGTLSDFETLTDVDTILSPIDSIHTYNSFKNNTADWVKVSIYDGGSQMLHGMTFHLNLPVPIKRPTCSVTFKIRTTETLRGATFTGAVSNNGSTWVSTGHIDIDDDDLVHTITKTYTPEEFNRIGWYNCYNTIYFMLDMNGLSSYPDIEFSIGNIELEGYTEELAPGGTILISPINSNRISRLCNRPNATNESIPNYKMTIESKNSGYVINGNQTLNNSTKGQFFSGSAGRNCAINLLGTQVAYHQWHGDRTDSYHEPINFLFVPKGLPNPYSGLSGETRFAMQKVFNYILKRPER